MNNLVTIFSRPSDIQNQYLLIGSRSGINTLATLGVFLVYDEKGLVKCNWTTLQIVKLKIIWCKPYSVSLRLLTFAFTILVLAKLTDVRIFSIRHIFSPICKLISTNTNNLSRLHFINSDSWLRYRRDGV
jgi:hypothetical protein